jgi:hemolysin III
VSSSAVALAPAPKPLLRGVSHKFAFFVALAASVVLVLRAPSGTAAWSTAVFGASLVTLFGTSALYHRVDWSDAARMRMRRLDHSAIFILIAGGYTPLFAITASSGRGFGALAAIWIGAGVGVVQSLAWPRAPKWVTALLCVGLGWMVTGPVIDRAPLVGGLAVGLLVACGVVYSLGALVYAMKRPDPRPLVFGYHEVFHALVIVASVLLFAHVVTVVPAR